MSFTTNIISATTISGTTLYGDGYYITNINEQEFYLWDLVVQGNKLLNGGVSFVSGLTFDVSVLSYIIDGTIYDVSSFTTITLNSGDTSFDRIDVIYVDTNGLVGVVEGTPSANPVKPNLDGDTQVEISFVLIPVNGTTVGGVSEFKIYEEDLGPPSEWLFSSFGSQSLKISGDSTEDAYSGTTSIKVDSLTGSSLTTYGSGFILSGTTGPVDINNYATIQFAIKNFSANTNTNRIRFKLLNQNGSANGNLVYMNATSSPSSYIKYISSNFSNWQLISIPLWRFGVTNTNVYGVEVAFALNTVTPGRYRFDTLKFVEGVASSPPSNSWTTIKGDSTQTITATNPNATLTISGGTNLTSTIVSPSTIRMDVDSNCIFNSITATTSVQTNNLYGFSAITLNSSLQSPGSTASGNNSLSVGYQTKSLVDYSYTYGLGTTGTTNYSFAQGRETLASNFGSHAEGRGTIASGPYSHSEGFITKALGEASHSEGAGTIAEGDYQHVQGVYNATGNTTQGAFIIGNGTDDTNRSNLVFAAQSAFTINYDLNVFGTADINKATISNLVLPDSFTPSGSTDPSFDVGTITFDDDYLYWKSSLNGWLRVSGSTW